MNVVEPQCRNSVAGPCATPSVCIEWMKQRSSTWRFTSGKSDEEIRQYLVARYGDFVLYKPPLQRNTWLLWIGPFGLLLGGAIVWYAILRRRKGAAVDDDDKGTAPGTLPEEAVARARQAIYEEP